MGLFALFARSRIGQLVVLIGGVLLALGAFALRMLSAGRAQERARQDGQSLDTLRSRETTDDEIARTPASDRRERLRGWVRK